MPPLKTYTSPLSPLLDSPMSLESAPEELPIVVDHIKCSRRAPLWKRMTCFALIMDFVSRWHRLCTAMTGFAAGLIGDSIAQYTEFYLESTRSPELNLQWSLQLNRVLAVGCYQAILSAALYIPFYAWLDKIQPSGSKFGSLIAKVAMDDMVFVPFVEIPFFIIFTSYIEDKSIYDVFRNDWASAVRAGFLFNVPVSLCNFSLVPLPYRVMVLDVAECVWSGILSYVVHAV